MSAREPELDGIENELTDSVRRLADEVRSTVNDAMKTLRADLAAATREARQSARSTTSQERDDDPRVQARLRLHEADTAISDFRAALRTELRTQVASGRLPQETVTLLKERLGEVRSEIVASLRG